MPSRRLAGVAAVAAVAAIALAGCSNDPYDEAGLRAGLVDAGLTEREARCVVDGMEARISVDSLSARVPVTKRQRAKFAAVVDTCTADARP